MTGSGFLRLPEDTPAGQRLFDDDLAELGFVMNASRLWAFQPATMAGLFDLMRLALGEVAPDLRTRGILVAACVSVFGDSYCSLAWGRKLAESADPEIAAAVLRGTDDGLTQREAAMAEWARKVAREPNRTQPADVQQLRDAGLDEAEIFAITVFVALRLALATVNNALGAQPDAAFQVVAPPAVLRAVSYGRPIDGDPRTPTP